MNAEAEKGIQEVPSTNPNLEAAKLLAVAAIAVYNKIEPEKNLTSEKTAELVFAFQSALDCLDVILPIVVPKIIAAIPTKTNPIVPPIQDEL